MGVKRFDSGRRSFALLGSAAGLAWSGALRAESVSRAATLVVGTTQRPRHLNPAIQSGVATMMPGAQLFATPLRIAADWSLRPGLAQHWTISPDGLRLVLQLRPDARFHDGHPVTSGDLLFSLEVVRAYHPFRGVFDPIRSVRAVDTRAVEFELLHPAPALLLALSTVFLPVLPRHVYGNGVDLLTHPRNGREVVGSGPFRLSEFRPGEFVALDRFDDFYESRRAGPRRIVIREYRESTAALIALERGEIDLNVALSDPRELARAQRLSRVRVDTEAGKGIGPINWLAFNIAHPHLSDRRVRQAIALSIDREALVNTVFGGAVRRATGPIHSASPFYSAQIDDWRHDTARAARLLDEAGLPLGPDGRRLSLTLDPIPGLLDLRTSADFIRASLAKVGIEVRVRSAADFPSWARRVSEFEFDMALDTVWNWGDPAIGVHRSYLSANIRKGVLWSNMQQYANPLVDRLLERAAMESDFGRRRALYAQFQRQVVEDCPIVFLYEPLFAYAHTAHVRALPDSVWGAMAPMHEVALGD